MLIFSCNGILANRGEGEGNTTVSDICGNTFLKSFSTNLLVKKIVIMLFDSRIFLIAISFNSIIVRLVSELVLSFLAAFKMISAIPILVLVNSFCFDFLSFKETA